MGQATDVVALVTGGNTGIGEAVSRRLTSEGAFVAIGWFENEEGVGTLAKRLSAEGARCLAEPCDVTRADSVGEALERTENVPGSPVRSWA